MTRDYAKQPKRAAPVRNTRRQPTRKTLPGWLWMVAGILVGALVMAILNHKPAPAEQEVVEAVEEAPPIEQDTNAPRPRFDFYTLLKESEVILNDDGTPQPGTAVMPPPTLPPPSQPRDSDDKAAPEHTAQASGEGVTLSQPAPPPPA